MIGLKKLQKNMIEVEKLNKVYDKKIAVKNLSFVINKGSIIGLLGPNGCGKTTTIAMMLGLLKPTSGKVIIAALLATVQTFFFGRFSSA